MNIVIRDIPKEVINILDEFVLEQGYNSRNQLVVEILTRFSAIQNNLFAELLPQITRSILTEQIEKLATTNNVLLNTINSAIVKLVQQSQYIEHFIDDDLIEKNNQNPLFLKDIKNISNKNN